MTTLEKTPLLAASYFYRNDGNFAVAVVPDLLVTSNHAYIPICSKDVLFFTKNGFGAKVYCTNNVSFDIDISITELSAKLIRFSIFKHIKENLIINLDHVSSFRQNGQKYVFLTNGEEILLDKYLLSDLLESIAAA